MLVYPQIFQMLKQIPMKANHLLNLYREDNPLKIDGKLVFAPVAYVIRRKSNNLYFCKNVETNVTVVANCQCVAYAIFDYCASPSVKAKSHFVSPEPVNVVRLNGIPFLLCLN